MSIRPPNPPLSGLEGVRWPFSTNALNGFRATSFFQRFARQVDARDWMSAGEPVDFRGDAVEGALWFDYFADSGDSQRAVYSLAYALHGDLFVDGESVAIEGAEANKLARGRFVFFGGDSAYSVANRPTLQARLAAPFDAAFIERFPDPARWPADRPLLGIPGNHDWFDCLHGFNCLVREPVVGKGTIPLLGLKPAQQASYVAIDLPFGWQIWGIDAPRQHLDFRQRHYFRALADTRGVDRLILALPLPVKVFGEDDERLEDAKIFRPLGLTRTPPAGTTRLDIAGDVHHYARYDGTPAAAHKSIVAGLGGSLIDPTCFGPTAPAACHPEQATSKLRLRERLRSMPQQALGNDLWSVGAALGFAIAVAGACLSPAPMEVFDWGRALVAAGIVTLMLVAQFLLRHAREEGYHSDDRKVPWKRRLFLAAIALTPPLSWAVHASSLAVIGMALAVGVVVAMTVVGVRAYGQRYAPHRGACVVIGVVGGALMAGVPLGLGALIAPWIGCSAGAGLVGGLLGAFLLPTLFGWTLWLQTTLGAHALIVGPLTACDDDQAFVRFCLKDEGDKTTLTGWVIGIRAVSNDDIRKSDKGAPAMTIVDTFTITKEGRA